MGFDIIEINLVVSTVSTNYFNEMFFDSDSDESTFLEQQDEEEDDNEENNRKDDKESEKDMNNQIRENNNHVFTRNISQVSLKILWKNCHTRLHPGFSAYLKILQVLSCKMEPQSGIILSRPQPPNN